MAVVLWPIVLIALGIGAAAGLGLVVFIVLLVAKPIRPWEHE